LASNAHTQTRLKQKCNLDTSVAVKLIFEVSVPMGCSVRTETSMTPLRKPPQNIRNFGFLTCGHLNTNSWLL